MIFAGRPARLGAIEYLVFAEMTANARRVLTCERLLLHIWRRLSTEPLPPSAASGASWATMPEHPTCIFTELRVGYRTPTRLATVADFAAFGAQ